VFTEKLGEGRWTRNPAAFTFGAVLETAVIPARSVVGPLFADVRPGCP
jgi:hypothetical protein